MIDEEWFETRPFPDGITRIREPALGFLHAASLWLIEGRDAALLVDAGTGVSPLRPVIATLTNRPVICLLTHTHYDHVGGAWEFADRRVHAREAGVLAAPTPEATQWRGWLTDASFARAPYPSFRMADYAIRPAPTPHLVAEGDEIDLGGRRLRVLHVPGHSPGLVAVYEEASATLFTSDALYDGRMFFDLPGADRAAARASVARLAALPAETIHPGHGESFDGERLKTLAEAVARELA